MNNIDLEIETSQFELPASAMFTHSTRLADSFTPMPEIVWIPPRLIGKGTISISVRPGNTRELNIPFKSYNWKRHWNRRKTISLGNTFIFDSRYETDKNIAHQIQTVITRVLLARREISAALGRSVDITVIVRNGVMGYTQALYQQLGIPLLVTDSHVEGQLVRIEDRPVHAHQLGKLLFPDGMDASRSLIPHVVTTAPFRTPNPGNLPEKIYISRRGTRTISNDDEIDHVLRQHGFQRFYYEEEPYERQMLLSRHARVIVAIHGAAMTYMALNGNGLERPPGDLAGLRVIEIFGPGYIVDGYRRYAAVLNAHWCAVRGQITPEVVGDLNKPDFTRRHQATSFRVDPASLEMALTYSEKASRLPPSSGSNLYEALNYVPPETTPQPLIPPPLAGGR